MKNSILAGVAILLLGQGCTAAYLVREDRVKYELSSFDDLMLSTFKFDWSERVPKKLDDRTIQIGVEALVQNGAEKLEYRLLLKDARLELKGGSVPLKCTANNATDGISLRPGKKAALVCSGDVSINSAPALASSDQFAHLAIPYAAEGKAGQLRVGYKLKAEDFQK